MESTRGFRRAFGGLVAATILAASGCGQQAGVHRFEDPVAAGAPGSLQPTPSPLDLSQVGYTTVTTTTTSTNGGNDPSPAPNPTGSLTWTDWATSFLRYVGLPTCRNNIVAVVAWAAAENTKAAWNPLATTRAVPGARLFNSAGVKNYRSLQEGMRATAETLAVGLSVYGYGPIVAALSRCAAPMDTARAINASQWCRGCAGGTYVIGVVPAVERFFQTH